MARLTYRTHLAHLTCLTPLTLKPSNIATKSNARRNQPKPVDGDALRGLVGAHRAGAAVFCQLVGPSLSQGCFWPRGGHAGLLSRGTAGAGTGSPHGQRVCQLHRPAWLA